jgi:hypothetical protein
VFFLLRQCIFVVILSVLAAALPAARATMGVSAATVARPAAGQCGVAAVGFAAARPAIRASCCVHRSKGKKENVFMYSFT